MPRFTLKEMFLALTLISIGVGGLCWLFNPLDIISVLGDWGSFAVFGISCGAIGAGLGVFIQRPRGGICLGLLVAAFFAPVGGQTCGVGRYTLSIQIANEHEPLIKSVMCVPTWRGSEQFALLEANSGGRVPDAAIQEPFVGKPMYVDISTGETTGPWWRTTRYQQNRLVVVAKFEDGKQESRIVEIPDRDRSVTVEFP